MSRMILYLPDRIAAANHGLMSGSIRPKHWEWKTCHRRARLLCILGPGIELEVFDEDLTLLVAPHFIRNGCHDFISLLTKIEAYESCFSALFLHRNLFTRKNPQGVVPNLVVRVVIQRVAEAQVSVANEIVGK